MAPSATARSKSALMPMDSSLKPSASASRATSRKHLRTSAPVAGQGPTAIRPRTSRPAAAEEATRAGTCSGLAPWRPGGPAVLTCTSTAAAGWRRASARACSSLSRPCQSQT